MINLSNILLSNILTVRVRDLLADRITLMLAVFVALVALTVVSLAQTPVPLNVPTNQIFEQTNSWLQTFAPIVAIGVGIAVALAILRFIGKQIIDAF